jgi:hypothetical protein
VPSSTTVYITGEDNDVLRSTDSGHTFAEVNKSPSACKADSTGAFNDTAWISPSVGYLISNQFGYLYRTINGFGSASELGDGTINGYDETTKLAVDLGNASDLWVAAGGGLSEGISYSTNGGQSWTGANYTGESNILQDIANSGTTVVAVGQNGDIWTSPDGVNFYQQDAAAPDNTTNWDAVAVIPGTNTALVGGGNGALVITSTANQLPDKTPPTGTISGPKTLAPAQFGTYHINATDNPGGSGVNPASFVWSIPGQANQTGAAATFAFASAGSYTVTVSFSDLAGNPATATITITVKASAPSGSGEHTTTTGGATVGVYAKVKVSGAKLRYIPVKLSAKKRRKFVITLLTNKKKHAKTLAKMSLTLQGKATVHLRIGKSVKSGTYVLEVRIYTTGKHAKETGKRIKQVFVLD